MGFRIYVFPNNIVLLQQLHGPYYLGQRMTKPTKQHVHPAKTQIWSVFAVHSMGS